MKYVPSMMIGQLSGKAGSTVASRSRWGSYFRTRNMPTNPNTLAQQRVRDNMTEAATTWQKETQSFRDSWNTWALDKTRTDSLGAEYTLTGFAAFCMVSLDGATYTGAPYTPSSVPIDPSPAALSTAVLAADSAGTMTLTYTATPLATGIKLVIEVTAPISSGRNFVGRSEYVQLVVTAAAAASPANIYSAYVARFGDISWAAGQTIHFRTYTLQPEGLRSGYLYGSAVVA